MVHLSQRIVCSLFAFFIFIPVAFAEKDPKAAGAEATSEADPLTIELKPGEIFNCETDISYEWETIAKEKEESKKSKVFFQSLVERGKDGNLTKSRLETRLLDAKTRAVSACKSEHNVEDCTTKKIMTSAGEIRLLDFQTRRMMTANIIEECEKVAGNCLDASNTEIKCFVYRSPDVPAKKAEAAIGSAAPAKK